jgi:hypothetical protein
MCLNPTAKPAGPGGTTRDYLALIQGYARGMPTILGTEQTYKPGFVDTSLNATKDSAAGLLAQFKALSPEIGGVDTTNKAADLNALNTLGPAAAGAVNATNPEQAALLQQLYSKAVQGLNSGTSLLPDQARQITNYTNSSWANRGLGASGPALMGLTTNLASAGENAAKDRQKFALDVGGAGKNWLTDPALTLATKPSQTTAGALDFLNNSSAFGAGAGPTLISGDQNYDTFNTAYNARTAANINSANNRAAVLGSVASY